MTLQTVGPSDRGSLSVVYACPECGYEMAMLTNAYETQVVQSLGVRIGRGDVAAEASPSAATSGCPFSAMTQPDAPKPLDEGETAPIRWTPAAAARLARVPDFVRPMARTGIERFARERGASEIDEQMLDEAREFFGM